MSEDIFMMPATELVARYKAKSLSPVEATQAVLDRIDPNRVMDSDMSRRLKIRG